MPKDDLANDPAMLAWIETFADKEFARELCQFIEDYGVVGPGVAGIYVVEALQGMANVLRELGWGNDKQSAR